MSFNSSFKAAREKLQSGFKKVAAKTSKAFKSFKEDIRESQEEKKAEKERIHQEELKKYQNLINDIKNNIDNKELLEFLNTLGPSKSELTFKTVKKMKTSFPIPIEQNILWAFYVVKTTRCGGLLVTEKGVFIKTVVDIVEEKNFKKEKRKVSELFYYPWELFPFDTFEESSSTAIASIGAKELAPFIKACKDISSKDLLRREKSSTFYDRNIHVMEGATVGAAGSVFAQTQKNTRDWSLSNNNPGGHGFFAEEANTMADKLQGEHAKTLHLNTDASPDRLVNGVEYQTKYYKTGIRSVNATFDENNGLYKYYSNGKPMKLEVPKDQYEGALEHLKTKIAEGKVPGVSDPAEAEDILVKGHYTYEQARNMAKPGTIDSLKYDIETGAVVSLSALGISALITSFLCYRKTKDPQESMISGILAGGKIGALTLTTHVLVSQLARTKAFHGIMTKNVVGLGIANAVVGFVVFSIPDTYKVAFKKISLAQYATNLAVLSAGIVGGAVGSAAGAAIGTTAGAAAGMGVGSPALATAGAVGGIAGGVTVGAAAGIGTAKLIDIFYEGDDKRILRLFNAYTMVMLAEYMLSEEEIDEFVKVLDRTSDRIFKKFFENVHKSKQQEKVIREFLAERLDEIVKKREHYYPDIEYIEMLKA